MSMVRLGRWTGALALTAALLIMAVPARAATPRLIPVGTFDQPVYVTAPPGDTQRVFVVERGGTIQVLDNGVRHQFLDLGSRVLCCDGERGLESLAFAPDYATTGRFYVFYTAQPSGDVTVAELRRSAGNPDTADPASWRLVLSIPHDQQSNHNGGQLQFGPDGDLYVGTGDGGSGDDPAGNGQNLTSRTPPVVSGVNHDPLLGKILRIDPRGGAPYAVPGDNPFAAPAREVFAYGFRNPWRFSFDRATGDLIVGDVGQDAYEEVDFAPSPARGRGENFGWSRYEGLHTAGGALVSPPFPAGFTFPVLEKSHGADGFCAITGGYVVRDPALPELAGQYVYGDFCAPALRSVRLAPGGASGDHALGLSVPSLSSFGEDGCGRVYAVSLDGPVSRLGTTGACSRASAPGGSGSPPPASLPTVSIADASARERDRGRHRMTFAVTLSRPSAGTVSVGWATARGGAARAPRDYTAASGRVSFAPGATRGTVTVRVRGDRLAERRERFAVRLSQPSGATILDGTARGTIRDDDRLLGRIRVHGDTFRVRVGAPGRATWRFSTRGTHVATLHRRVRHIGRTTVRPSHTAGLTRLRAHLRYVATTGRRGTRTRTVQLAG